MSLLDIAAQLNPGGPEAVRAAARRSSPSRAARAGRRQSPSRSRPRSTRRTTTTTATTRSAAPSEPCRRRPRRRTRRSSPARPPSPTPDDAPPAIPSGRSDSPQAQRRSPGGDPVRRRTSRSSTHRRSKPAGAPTMVSRRRRDAAPRGRAGPARCRPPPRRLPSAPGRSSPAPAAAPERRPPPAGPPDARAGGRAAGRLVGPAVRGRAASRRRRRRADRGPSVPAPSGRAAGRVVGRRPSPVRRLADASRRAARLRPALAAAAPQPSPRRAAAPAGVEPPVVPTAAQPRVFVDAAAIRAAAQAVRAPAAGQRLRERRGRARGRQAPAADRRARVGEDDARARRRAGRGAGRARAWRHRRHRRPAHQPLLTEAAARGRWVIVGRARPRRPDAALGALSTFLAGIPVTLDGETRPSPPTAGGSSRPGTARRRAAATVLRRFAAIEVTRPPATSCKALQHARTTRPAAAAVETLLALGSRAARRRRLHRRGQPRRAPARPPSPRTTATLAARRSPPTSRRCSELDARDQTPETRRRSERAALARAKATLDQLGFYPEPVNIDHVRILHVPWLFRLPWFRRFHGYEMGPLILLKLPLAQTSRRSLIAHELCHVWQDQDHRLRMWWSYVRGGYATTRTKSRRAAPAPPPRSRHGPGRTHRPRPPQRGGRHRPRVPGGARAPSAWSCCVAHARGRDDDDRLRPTRASRSPRATRPPSSPPTRPCPPRRGSAADPPGAGLGDPHRHRHGRARRPARHDRPPRGDHARARGGLRRPDGRDGRVRHPRPELPITFAAREGERVVLAGGRRAVRAVSLRLEPRDFEAIRAPDLAAFAQRLEPDRPMGCAPLTRSSSWTFAQSGGRTSDPDESG